jgi:hypothetical protein
MSHLENTDYSKGAENVQQEMRQTQITVPKSVRGLSDQQIVSMIENLRKQLQSKKAAVNNKRKSLEKI